MTVNQKYSNVINIYKLEGSMIKYPYYTIIVIYKLQLIIKWIRQMND